MLSPPLSVLLCLFWATSPLYYKLTCLSFFRNFYNLWSIEGTKFYFLVLFSIKFFFPCHLWWFEMGGKLWPVFAVSICCLPDEVCYPNLKGAHLYIRQVKFIATLSSSGNLCCEYMLNIRTHIKFLLVNAFSLVLWKNPEVYPFQDRKMEAERDQVIYPKSSR